MSDDHHFETPYCQKRSVVVLTLRTPPNASPYMVRIEGTAVLEDNLLLRYLPNKQAQKSHRKGHCYRLWASTGITDIEAHLIRVGGGQQSGLRDVQARIQHYSRAHPPPSQPMPGGWLRFCVRQCQLSSMTRTSMRLTVGLLQFMRT